MVETSRKGAKYTGTKMGERLPSSVFPIFKTHWHYTYLMSINKVQVSWCAGHAKVIISSDLKPYASWGQLIATLDGLGLVPSSGEFAVHWTRQFFPLGFPVGTSWTSQHTVLTLQVFGFHHLDEEPQSSYRLTQRHFWPWWILQNTPLKRKEILNRNREVIIMDAAVYWSTLIVSS